MMTFVSKYKFLGAYSFLILAQIMVGINIVGSKYLVGSIPVLVILAIRFSLGAGILLVLHWLTDRHSHCIRRHLQKLHKKDWMFIIAQALTAGVLFNFLMLFGLHYTNANVAGIITSALPAIIAIMSWIVLKERLSRKKIVCVGFATLGLLVISADKFSSVGMNQSILGNFIIFLSLLPEAAYYVLTKLHINLLPIFLVSALINAINAIVLLPILLFYLDAQFLSISPVQWIILLLISIVSGLFFVFWYLGSDKVDGVVASLSTAIMPIATVVIAWLALGEVITVIQFLGMGLVIVSILAYVLSNASSLPKSS